MVYKLQTINGDILPYDNLYCPFPPHLFSFLIRYIRNTQAGLFLAYLWVCETDTYAKHSFKYLSYD